MHVGATAHGETTGAVPGAGQASSPAATPTDAASTRSTTHVPQSARAPEQGIHASQRAQPLEGADAFARTRRARTGMSNQSAIAPARLYGLRIRVCQFEGVGFMTWREVWAWDEWYRVKGLEFNDWV